MTLNELQKSCEIEASIIKVKAVGENGEQIIKTYDMLSKSELANLYCDWDEKSWFATDEEEKAKAEKAKTETPSNANPIQSPEEAKEATDTKS